MFVEVQALQGLCYIVIPYSTKNKSSMSSMSMSMWLNLAFVDCCI